MDFLSVALQCSFLPVTVGAIPDSNLGMPGFVLQAGQGSPCKPGDRVTVEFWIQDEAGKEIANSERRGVGHTFDLFSKPGDALLNGATLGAKPGEERILVLFAEDWLEEIGPLNMIRSPGPLVIRIKVARVDRR